MKFIIYHFSPSDCNVTSSTYTLTDDNILTVNWQQDNAQINLCGQFIDVTLTLLDCQGPGCVQTVNRLPATNRAYTFPNMLEACANYEYKIYERDDDAVTGPSATVPFYSKEMFEYLQISVSQEENEETNLNVFWNVTQYMRCEKSFRVTAHISGVERKSEDSKGTNHTLKMMEPCVTYIIAVQPMSSLGPLSEYGDSKEITMRIFFSKGIRDLTLSYDSTPSEEALVVDWVEPEFAAKCVTYEVFAETEYDKREPKKVNTTRTSFSSVIACAAYTVTVIAKYPNGMQDSEVKKELRIPSRGKLKYSVEEKLWSR